jgi:flagellin-like protein
MKRSRNEEAVSEIIGIIILVAVVVILAAIIGSFVFGMAEKVPKGKVVAATAVREDTNVVVTWNGGLDNDKVIGYDISIDGVMQEANITPDVGSTRTFTLSSAGPTSHIVVAAAFIDDSSQVVLDTFV